MIVGGSAWETTAWRATQRAAEGIECGKIATVWVCYSTGGYQDMWKL